MMVLTSRSARTFAVTLSFLLLPVAAGAEIAIQAYALAADSGPHDVAPSPEPGGPVWYTAQRQGALGRLDPATGAVEQIPLGSGSAPHGVIVGPDGAPWITDSGLNAIVRVDAGTREVRVFRLPAERSNVNLNTAAFDRNGKLWFTGQNGVYGRLDPETKEMRVWDAPDTPGRSTRITRSGGNRLRP
jgi:virginiamycin B lyase